MYFDIGSNIGKWSLSNINQCDKIISIEASPITFNKLVNNCKNNKILFFRSHKTIRYLLIMDIKIIKM